MRRQFCHADANERDAGIASGVNNAVARIAGLLGIAVVGAAIAGSDNRLDLSGYRVSMAITAGLAVTSRGEPRAISLPW